MKNKLKNEIKKLLSQESILKNKRRKLEAIDYNKNEEIRIKGLLGKFFAKHLQYDYEKEGYGRLLSYEWKKEEGRKYIETITEYFGRFDWQIELQRGTLTDFRVDHDFPEDRWYEITGPVYYKKLEKLLNKLDIKTIKKYEKSKNTMEEI